MSRACYVGGTKAKSDSLRTEEFGGFQRLKTAFTVNDERGEGSEDLQPSGGNGLADFLRRLVLDFASGMPAFN